MTAKLGSIDSKSDTRRISDAIGAGLDFLAARQMPSGQFPVEVTSCFGDEPRTRPDDALFATSHIVYSLGYLPQPSSCDMISRALSYFQSEMSGHGLWRYWNRDAKWHGRSLYSFIPADLDDIASISYLLQRHSVPFPDNRGLMLYNRDRNGLFYTWLMLRPNPPMDWLYWRTLLAEVTIPRYTVFFKATEAGYNDVDGVVNANVLLYLGERPETQAVVEWLIDIVETGQEATCDKWYRDPFPFYYALSRNFHAGVRGLESAKGVVVERLEAAARADGQVGENVLQTALAANSLLNFGERSEALEQAVGHLLRSQGASGSWPSAPFYYGGPKKLNSWGSDELTTAICLEALQRFLDVGSVDRTALTLQAN